MSKCTSTLTQSHDDYQLSHFQLSFLANGKIGNSNLLKKIFNHLMIISQLKQILEGAVWEPPIS